MAVVSDHSIETPWKESVLISGDVVAELKKLKEGDGPPIQVNGSIRSGVIFANYKRAGELKTG